MKKRLLALMDAPSWRGSNRLSRASLVLAVALLFIVPGILQAITVERAEDVAPGDALFTADFQLGGRLKKLLEPLIENALHGGGQEFLDDKGIEKLEVLSELFLDGKRFFVSFSAPENILFSFPVTSDQWEILMTDTEKHDYQGVPVYLDESYNYLTQLGNLAVVGPSLDAIHAAIDLSKASAPNSLSANSAYQNFTSSYLPERTMGLTINWQEVVKLVKPLLEDSLGGGDENGVEVLNSLEDSFGGEDEKGVEVLNSLFDFLSLLEFEGVSFGETEAGYVFNMKVTGNAAGLAKEGYSFASGGSFTPNLYQKFPNATPILYTESFNPKAEFEQSKKIFGKFEDALVGLLGAEGAKGADIFEAIEDETGLDIEKIYGAFSKEFAFGVQHSEESPLPYFTVMAHVAASTPSAQGVVDNITDFMAHLIQESDAPKGALVLKKEDGFTKLHMNPAKFDENYDGPPFPKIVFTTGITDDGLFIFSNYPGIEKAENRTGFAGASGFSEHMAAETGPSTGIFYLNARNVWGFVDQFMSWAEEIGGGENGPPLEFYQGYYGILENIYGWRDLFISSRGTDSEMLINGKITIDKVEHKTYEEFLDEMKSQDDDDDGQSNYDERYVYHTPVNVGDSDNDGVSDFEELQIGSNPDGDGRLYRDVAENTYYTDETAFLSARGCISGYADKSFQPGRQVNRAEFATMIVKCFEQGTSNFLGVDVELKASAPPFKDLDSEAWYYTPIAKAYRAGFVSGSMDLENGGYIFRPGDNITRAEAIAILNKASEALGQTKSQAKCEQTPFKDVAADAWYCDEVANAYSQGITKGKSADSFRPNDFLSRAEAAVMIKRTLEKDLEAAARKASGISDLASPLTKKFGGGGDILR